MTTVKYTNYGDPGIKTQTRLSQEQLARINDLGDRLTNNSFVSLKRVNEKNWMGLRKENNDLLLQIHNSDISYNCRAKIDTLSGFLTVLKGVDYPGLTTEEDAEKVAGMAVKLFSLSPSEENIVFTNSINDASKMISTISDIIDPEKYARKIYNFLSKKTNKNNDHHYGIINIEKNKTIDCDDFAKYFWKKFTDRGLEVKVLQIDKPYYDPKDPSRYHVLCLYKTAKGWKYADHQKFGKETTKDYKELPALRSGYTVKFRIIDVQEEFFKGNDDNPNPWLTSVYKGD